MGDDLMLFFLYDYGKIIINIDWFSHKTAATISPKETMCCRPKPSTNVSLRERHNSFSSDSSGGSSDSESIFRLSFNQNRTGQESSQLHHSSPSLCMNKGSRKGRRRKTTERMSFIGQSFFAHRNVHFYKDIFMLLLQESPCLTLSMSQRRP